MIYLPATGTQWTESSCPAPRAAARKARILVMDDEEIIRRVAGELLEAVGHEAAFAEHGEAALSAYRDARAAPSTW